MGITIALNRGRLLKEMLPMLDAIDMAPADSPPTLRGREKGSDRSTGSDAVNGEWEVEEGQRRLTFGIRDWPLTSLGPCFPRRA